MLLFWSGGTLVLKKQKGDTFGAERDILAVCSKQGDKWYVKQNIGICGEDKHYPTDEYQWIRTKKPTKIQKIGTNRKKFSQ